MLLVPVIADRSPIHGLGLFARERIPRGTPIWRFCPGFDRVFTAEAMADLPAPAVRHLETYAYFDAARRHWVLNGDLTIFMNHSPTPNTGAPDVGVGSGADETVALRDIETGEELTCDYRSFDAAPKPIP